MLEDDTAMKRRINVTWLVTYGGLGIALVLIAIILFWLSVPTDALVIKNSPVTVTPKSVNEKTILVASVDYCKNTKTRGIVKRYIVTQFREIPLPLQNDDTRKGCQKVDIPIVMPEMLRSSPAHLRWEVEYKLNPIRTVNTEFTSEPFTIIGSN